MKRSFTVHLADGSKLHLESDKTLVQLLDEMYPTPKARTFMPNKDSKIAIGLDQVVRVEVSGEESK
jgi:hypothetical protein